MKSRLSITGYLLVKEQEPRMIHCAYLKTNAPGLAAPPMFGQLGEKIFNIISEEGWKIWLIEQTKFINERRLNPIDPYHKKLIVEHMKVFLALI